MTNIIALGISLYGGLVAVDYIARICRYAKKRGKDRSLYLYKLSHFLPFPFDIIHDELRSRRYLRKFEKITEKTLENLEKLDLKTMQDLRCDELYERDVLPKRIDDLED